MARTIATADVTINVAAGQSIQAAVNSMLNDYDLNGHYAYIQLADGTYTESVSIPRQPLGQNLISIRGNPNNYGAVQWVAPAGQTCLSVQNGGIGVVAYVEMSAPNGGVLLATRQNAVANFVYGRLGYATVKMAATANSTINCNGYHAIMAGGSVCFDATLGGNILLHGQSFSVINDCSFDYFCRAVGSGANISFMGATYSGATVTGCKGLAANNGVIDAGGSTIPGTSAVVTQNGGVSV